MATTRRAMVLSAFVLQLLMVGATPSPLADSTNPLGDASKMNADLIERLEEVDDRVVPPVIFQLHSPETNHDEAFMVQLGLELWAMLRWSTVAWLRRSHRCSTPIDMGPVEYLELDKPSISSTSRLNGAVNPTLAS